MRSRVTRITAGLDVFRRVGWTPRRSATRCSARADSLTELRADLPPTASRRRGARSTSRRCAGTGAVSPCSSTPPTLTPPRRNGLRRRSAPQALLFLNHPFVLAQARHLAARLRLGTAVTKARASRSLPDLVREAATPERGRGLPSVPGPDGESARRERLAGTCPHPHVQQRVYLRRLIAPSCGDRSHVGENATFPPRILGTRG